MKSVLISIRPKWCEKIARGKKTIEVRKTAPKEVPFKAYIYCSKEKKQDDIIWAGAFGDRGKWNEHVIGEFICDKVYKIEPIFSFCDCYSGYDDSSDFSYFEDYSIDSERLKKTCLTRQELYIYGKEETLYGWHISDLKIFDKPKKLREFCIPCKTNCENCKKPLFYDCWEEKGRVKLVTRPPQSYMYVEYELKGENDFI